MFKRSTDRVVIAVSLTLSLVALAGCQPAPAPEVEEATVEKIPVTTSSEKARELFLEGRALNDKLRATDAHEYFTQAVEADPGFAWAHLLVGFTGSTAQEFWDSLEAAVEHAESASQGERLLILAAEAAAKGNAEQQMSYLSQLVAAYPDDERAHNALGGAHFGRQEYQSAIDSYSRAIELAPEFSAPYNQNGYALRALGDFEGAEASFQKYVELIPDDPNPYDSYAELLMKMGRFEESIEKYRQALEQDPNFIASYIGIANNQIFMGQPTEARATLEELAGVARNVGEERATHFWTAQSYLHEGDFDAALASCETLKGLAETDGDLATVAGDLNLMGDIQLAAGNPDAASTSYAESIAAIERADVSDEVKENAKRNILFDKGRVALARGDVDAATEIATAYGQQVAAKQIPFEIRQHHELEGMVALAKDDEESAVTHLEQANQQNPRVLYLLAKAYQGMGNDEAAREYCDKAANFNGLNANYGYVRTAAQQMLAEL